MASNNTQQSRYRMISIMTFVVLLLAFSYYYFVYVKSNEDAFNSKSFRIIEQVGSNIENKYKNYKDVVGTAWKNKDGKYGDQQYLCQAFDTIVQLKNIVSDKYSVPAELFGIAQNNFQLSDPVLAIDSIVVCKGSKEHSTIFFYAAVQKLVEGTHGNDFFEKYIVFSDKQVYWSNFRTAIDLTIHNDTLFKREKNDLNNLFHSTDRLEIEFNNKAQLLYFTPVRVSGETLYIGGIIERSHFNQQAFKLGTNTLIVILVLPLLLIFSFPFLKLLLLSENERLGTWDAILSFIVLVLGFGFLFLTLLAYYSQSGPSAKHKKNVLKTYAKQIEKNVLAELNDILSQIDINQATIKKEEEILSGGATAIVGNGEEGLYDKTKLSPRYGNRVYPYSKGESWLNKEAQQLVKWRDTLITPRVEVPFRKYFSEPYHKGNLLWADENLNNGSGFHIEAIRAVTTGESYAVVSKRADIITLSKAKFDDKETVVVTMGAKFESLTGLSLPANISYLVIDEEGMVLFHKNSARILQENLFDETNQNIDLIEAVYGMTDTIFRSNYNEVHSRFYISPLGNLPLYLLVVLDEDQEKMSDAQVLSLTVLLYFLLFVLLLIQISLFVATDYRRKRKTKGYSLFFRWVWPMPSRKWAFQLLSLYLLLSLVVFLAGSFYEHIFVTFSFFSFLVTVNLFVLRRFKKPFNLKGKPYYIKYYFYFVLMLITGTLLFPFSDHLNTGQLISFSLFLIVSFATVIVSFFVKDADESTPFHVTYNVWVFLFVLLIGLLSILSFYTRAYNFEKSVSFRHQQLSLAKDLVLNDYRSDTNKYHKYSAINELFFEEKIDSIDPGSISREQELITELRIRLGKDIDRSAVLNYPSALSGERIQWSESDSKIQLSYDSGGRIENENNPLILTSKTRSLKPLDFLLLNKIYFYGLRLELLFGLLLFAIVLYLVIAYWSSKLFLLGIIPKLQSNIANLLAKSDFVYVVSPPHAGVRPFIEEKLDTEIYFEDLRYPGDTEISNKKPGKNDRSALLFDSGSIDKETLKRSVERINTLKQLVLDKKLEKLVVVSQFTPKKVLNTVIEREQILRANEQASALPEFKKLSDQYLDIIGGFSLAYFKIGTGKSTGETSAENFLDNELKGISILDKEMLSKILNDRARDQEDIVLSIQNKAQLYYYAIWNSLEKRERLLIYDLAQDGLVNYRNLYVIYNLMSRGILVHRNGRLMLFNKSFANFVLSIIDIEQALEFERDAKRTGNWANLKLPFLIVIAAALMFMFLTQQEVFSELIGWFTAAIAMLPILTRFILTFSGFSGKK